MIQGEPGIPLLLELMLVDRTSSVYPRARIIDDAGSQIGSPIDLSPAPGFSGLYQGQWLIPVAGDFSAAFEVFQDAGYSALADYEPTVEHIRIREPAVDLSAAAVDSIWDELLSSHLIDGSAGRALFASGGMAGLHIRDDAVTYDVNDRPTKVRRRFFTSAASAAASTPGGTGEGEVLTIEGDATHISATKWQSLLRRTP